MVSIALTMILPCQAAFGTIEQLHHGFQEAHSCASDGHQLAYCGHDHQDDSGDNPVEPVGDHHHHGSGASDLLGKGAGAPLPRPVLTVLAFFHLEPALASASHRTPERPPKSLAR